MRECTYIQSTQLGRKFDVDWLSLSAQVDVHTLDSAELYCTLLATGLYN